MNFKFIVKNNIHEYRTLCGLTQAELASMAGLTLAEFRRIEYGGYPNVHQAYSLCFALNESFGDLFYFERVEV